MILLEIKSRCVLSVIFVLLTIGCSPSSQNNQDKLIGKWEGIEVDGTIVKGTEYQFFLEIRSDKSYERVRYKRDKRNHEEGKWEINDSRLYLISSRSEESRGIAFEMRNDTLILTDPRKPTAPSKWVHAKN